jgi:hypothetical protein
MAGLGHLEAFSLLTLNAGFVMSNPTLSDRKAATGMRRNRTSRQLVDGATKGVDQ